MLSCYTTNLIGHLWREDPTVDARFAAAVDLSVRTDLPDGTLAFTHHRRFEPGMSYRAAATWDTAHAALLDEFERDGDVLAVANARNLPWSPAWNTQDVPHWIRLADHRVGRWLVVDGFEALLPLGHHQPHRGWVNDADLAALLTPLPALPEAVQQRDVHALGAAQAVPPPQLYRWLEHGAAPRREEDGQWVHGTRAALTWLAERLAEDQDALRRHTEDLWAAGRHHQYRLAGDERAVDAWGELARALRFAVQSADRGRPRPSLVTRAFDQVIEATDVGTVGTGARS
jgi:hypothetical protein